TYTDTSTFTGGDTDPGFDTNDELVFMACNAGDLRAPGAPEPAGVLAGTGWELTVTNPLGSDTAFVYLFESNGTLDPAAGATALVYDFDLLSGPYKTTYGTMNGPNPENTTLTTPAYAVHFADRWIRDETRVFTGGADSSEILDRHKSLFAPGVCQRSEDTFSAGEGAFIVNRGGPVRVLRGYVGANSGPTTHRIHAFYESREDLYTALRVHAIAGIIDYFDYSSAAIGMTYSDDFNAGLTIDGVPDAATSGEITWQMVTGTQGTLAQGLLIESDIPNIDFTSYYSDDVTPTVTQCTGDGNEYGASGFWEQDPIPNTDPALGTFNTFETTRVIAYAGPNASSSFGPEVLAEASNPVQASASAYAPVATGVAGGSVERSPLAVGPNPFRGELSLRWSLPASGGAISLMVYDLAGRLVRSLDASSQTSGVTRWDGRDARGEHVEPGVYFVHFQAGDFSARRKVVLLK
ncbi:MAG: T9SS type A sorting domain-containing protein, partial [Gemmatimonadetes bacterium]|nr:T9SS type A sorting domain-containing protein [Gemmatimonadota bacterium]